MPSRTLGLLAALALICGAGLHAQVPTYPFRDYSMARDAELALVRTAAPSSIVDRATVKVLTQNGYQVAREGDNGFTCLVMRGWSAPTYTPNQFRDFSYDATIRAPICFDPIAARTVLPYYELRSTLGMAGKTPAQIADAVASAYATGALPKREGVSFAYMCRRSSIWVRHRSLAPAYDGVRPVLHERDGWRKCVRKSAPAVER